MRTILVVEDEFLLAAEYALILEEAGWSVVGPAATVDEALNLLGNSSPTVALLDLHLRRDLATPVAEKLRERGIPFVAASAADDLVAIAGEVFRGIQNLGKPLQANELILAVNGIAETNLNGK